MGVKVLDGSGQGRSSAVMAGIIWAVANRDRYNIRVLNLSIGSNPVAPTEFDPIAKAVEFAWMNGITVVCAAGNEGEYGPRRHPLSGQQPLRHHRGRHGHLQTPELSDDAVAYYSSVGPTCSTSTPNPTSSPPATA